MENYNFYVFINNISGKINTFFKQKETLRVRRGHMESKFNFIAFIV
jgi:hypothetical protein